MALTIAPVSVGVAGNRRVVVADVTFDSSYDSGGEAFTPALLGLTVIETVLCEDSGTETIVYDRANGKLRIYTADGTEQGTGTSAATIATRVTVRGI